MAANGASTHERSTRPIRPEDRSPRGAHEGSSRAARPAEVRRESFQGILEGDDQVSVVFSIDEPPRTVRFLVQLPSKLDRHSRGGDTILDPFCGSGTTGLVALRLGRKFVGIELNPEYAAMAERRIREDAPLINEVEVLA